MEALCVVNLAFSIAILVVLLQKSRKKEAEKPIILIDNSKISALNLKRANISIEELMSRARISGYFNLGDIDTAVFEPNGEISFLPSASRRRLSPKDFNFSPIREGLSRIIIYNGEFFDENLKLSGIKKDELEKLLEQRGSKPGEIFLATANEAGRVDFY